MILLRISTFLKSLFFHIYSGFPKTTKKEILKRWEICNKCEKFDDIKIQCKICGCNLSKKSKFLNKLAWADQECPEKKWLKTTRK